MKNKYTFADYLIALALAIFFVWCLIGCGAVAKYKDSPKFAEDCAERFPVKVETVTIQGKADTIITPGVLVPCDTVTILEHDTVTNVVTKRVTKVGKCPPDTSINRTDTLIKTIENTARVKVLEAQLNAANEANKCLAAKVKNRTKQRNWLFWILVALGVYSQRHRLISTLGKIGRLR